MVSQREAVISSTLTASIITGAHGAAHYVFGNPESFAAAGVT